MKYRNRGEEKYSAKFINARCKTRYIEPRRQYGAMLGALYFYLKHMLGCSTSTHAVSQPSAAAPLLNLLHPVSYTQGQTHFEGKEINIWYLALHHALKKTGTLALRNGIESITTSHCTALTDYSNAYYACTQPPPQPLLLNWKRGVGWVLVGALTFGWN